MSFAVYLIEDPDAENLKIVHSCEARTEKDQSLDVAKLGFVGPDDVYLGYTYENGKAIYSQANLQKKMRGFSAIKHSEPAAKTTGFLAGSPPASLSHDPPQKTTILLRQIRDFDDDPNFHVIKTWEAHLEPNFALDTTKIDHIKPKEIFLGKSFDGVFGSLINDGPKVLQSNILQHYLEDLDGVPVPVLTIISRIEHLPLVTVD
ncbi:hypothetical protein DXG01_004848 [Tephrocybe rancida]|nr:hypothetical protein DXG01_004848 [Tephrocybe rancida]